MKINEKIDRAILEARKNKETLRIKLLQTVKTDLDALIKAGKYSEAEANKALLKMKKQLKEAIDSVKTSENKLEENATNYIEGLKRDISIVEEFIDDKFKEVSFSDEQIKEIIEKYNFKNIGDFMKGAKSKTIEEFKGIEINLKEVSEQVKNFFKNE